MPKRLLRDWTNSYRMNQVSVNAENFFARLIMKADDYGRFFATTPLLKANLYPLKLDTVREADISRWISELENTTNEKGEKAGVIVIYEVEGKRYLQIDDFGQRKDKSASKFPDPPNGFQRLVPNRIESVLEAKADSETKSDAEAKAAPPANGLIYSLERTYELFFSDNDCIEYTYREKSLTDVSVAKKFMESFWNKQKAKGNITTRPYSDFKSHYINSVPSISIKESINGGSKKYQKL